VKEKVTIIPKKGKSRKGGKKVDPKYPSAITLRKRKVTRRPSPRPRAPREKRVEIYLPLFRVREMRRGQEDGYLALSSIRKKKKKINLEKERKKGKRHLS